jgi:hypothetical protein
MKKLYSVLLVVALMTAMVLPVMAAPSPQATAETAKNNATVAVAGAEVKTLSADVYAAVTAVATNPQTLASLGVNTAAKMAAAFDLNVKIPDGQSSVSVPITVSNAKAGDYAVILHRKDNVEGKPWEKVGEGYLGADLTVTGTFTSFSPVVVMVTDASSVSAAGAKAPKTGEF